MDPVMFWTIFGTLGMLITIPEAYETRLFDKLGRSGHVISGTFHTVGVIMAVSARAVLPLLDQPTIPIPSEIAQVSGLLLFTVGTYIMYLVRGRLGVRRVLIYSERESPLQTDGIFGVVRHPLYHAVIIQYVGWALIFRASWALILAVLWAAMTAFTAYLEEKDLETRYGEEYTEYRKKVPALIPKLR